MEPMLDPHPDIPHSDTPHSDTTHSDGQESSGHQVSSRGSDGLTDREHRILEMERIPWRSAGAKELAVRTELGLSPARYHQVLNALLDAPEALRADPMLVKRLRRIRDARVHARRVRRFRAPAAGSEHE